MPMPVSFVVKKGSNRRGKLDCSIPQPESETIISTLASVVSAGTYGKPSSPGRLVIDGVHSVHDEVQKHLLQMDPVPLNGRQLRGKFRRNLDMTRRRRRR